MAYGNLHKHGRPNGIGEALKALFPVLVISSHLALLTGTGLAREVGEMVQKRSSKHEDVHETWMLLFWS
jgi:hypothetical protein